MSGVKYHLDIKDIDKSENQNNINVNVYGCEDKKIFLLHILPWALQIIAWIYYISLLVKHLITFCWKTWADWYQDKIIISTTKNIFDNIVYMTKPVKRYWKKHLERCKLHGAQRIKLTEADGKKEHNKVKPRNTE